MKARVYLIGKLLISMIFMTGMIFFYQGNRIIASASEDYGQVYIDLLNQSDVVTHTDFKAWEITEEEYSEIQELTQEIVKGIDDSYNKAITIHDWIAGNIYYD